MLDRIVRAAALTSGDRVLEVGPGLGALTLRLASASAFVTAVEIDPLLEPILRETLRDLGNVRLVFQDFLKLDLGPFLDEAFGFAPGVVVASIPYYITSPILERLLEHKQLIARIVLLVQQEVADRLAARPSTEQYGSMSVFAQYHARVEVLGSVSRNVFLPAPEVSSAIVRLTPELPGTVEVEDEALFFRIVRAAFGQRRKTILNALSAPASGLNRGDLPALLAATGIDPTTRGETLSLEEFARLANAAGDGVLTKKDQNNGPAAGGPSNHRKDHLP